jgi:hypothetical protein
MFDAAACGITVVHVYMNVKPPVVCSDRRLCLHVRETYLSSGWPQGAWVPGVWFKERAADQGPVSWCSGCGEGPLPLVVTCVTHAVGVGCVVLWLTWLTHNPRACQEV